MVALYCVKRIEEKSCGQFCFVRRVIMASSLPSCDWRHETSIPDRFFCRHEAIISAKLVNGMICRVCPARLLPCSSPRQVPDAEQIAQIAANDDKSPSLATKLWNVAHAVTAFVADGMQTVDASEYERRLQICDECQFRSNDHCSHCGCHLLIKARGSAFHCPVKLW